MKIVLAFLLVATLHAVPVYSQDKEKSKDDMAGMKPPPPLDDQMMKWMVGEWVGKTETPMGTSTDWQKIDWSLDKQFLSINYTMKMGKMTPEQLKSMAAMMKMPEAEVKKMMERPYKGMGQFSIDPTNGEFMGYWFDNMRGAYKGAGKMDGMKITSTWEGPRGSSVRTMEKSGNDTLVETFKETDKSGQVMEGKSTWTRKAK